MQLRQGGQAPLAMCPHILGTHRLTLAQERCRLEPRLLREKEGCPSPGHVSSTCSTWELTPVLCAVEISGCAQVDSEMINVLSYRGTHTVRADALPGSWPFPAGSELTLLGLHMPRLHWVFSLLSWQGSWLTTEPSCLSQPVQAFSFLFMGI